MSGLLLGDPSLHGMAESGIYSFSQDSSEEVCSWYLSRKEIEENSPSRRDGIDLKKETYLRKSYCTFLQDLGMRLKVPQVTIATAIIFCHRLFLRQSHARNDRRTIATVCMFLAGKVEETPRPLKDVILVSYEIIHKKDPAAAQRIKQKEVYEQQKELILVGERVVLATLGFDFNVHHPYKPLVEAIKKFKVAQNALAQVAWNFVNDGLRTSLCLQFKPHHIAAGAIFLAAKFLKVKLPSDGERVWWQEFDVTPRQLEEVSNQMLELYEQNRVLPSQGSEVEGSTGGGASHQVLTKTHAINSESASANSFVQAGGTSSLKLGASMPSSNRPGSHQSYADNPGGHRRSTQINSDYGSKDVSVISDHKVDDEVKDCRHPDQDSFLYNKDSTGRSKKKSRSGLERFEEGDLERDNGRSETAAGEWKNEDALYKSGSTSSQNLYREGPLGQSPHEAIKKIDKDKVKAALEKRRKSRGDVVHKLELMDEDDLIERELEDGVISAVEDGKIKRERRLSWPKSSNRQEPKNTIHVKDHEDIRDGNYMGIQGPSFKGPDAENAEEGEVYFYDDVNQGPQSSKPSNRKRKAGSPDKY